MTVTLELLPLTTNPELDLGAYLTLERADGRSLWRQRFVVERKTGEHYVLKPVDEMHGY